VDWVGSDRYNRGTGWAWPGGSIWASFDQIFNYGTTNGSTSYYQLFALGHGKPFFVGETSTRYDDATPTRKGDWYAAIAAAKHPDDPRYMANLIGVSVFDQYVTAEGNSDWRIDSDQTATMASPGTLGGFSQESLNGWIGWGRDPVGR